MHPSVHESEPVIYREAPPVRLSMKPGRENSHRQQSEPGHISARGSTVSSPGIFSDPFRWL